MCFSKCVYLRIDAIALTTLLNSLDQVCSNKLNKQFNCNKESETKMNRPCTKNGWSLNAEIEFPLNTKWGPTRKYQEILDDHSLLKILITTPQFESLFILSITTWNLNCYWKSQSLLVSSIGIYNLNPYSKSYSLLKIWIATP